MTKTTAQLHKFASGIKLIAFDVDGVLTDGRLYLGEDGNEYKAFHVRDGQGLVMMREAGLMVAIITARESQVVTRRMAELDIQYVYQNQSDKGQSIRELMIKSQLPPENIAYVGDDIIDLPAMALVGFKIAVADAHPMVRNYADWTTTAAGGNGAAREVAELVLRSQDRLPASYQKYHNDSP